MVVCEGLSRSCIGVNKSVKGRNDKKGSARALASCREEILFE